MAERDEVALQDDQALAQALGRQGAFGHLSRELLLVVNQDQQTVLQLSLIYTHTHQGEGNENKIISYILEPICQPSLLLTEKKYDQNTYKLTAHSHAISLAGKPLGRETAVLTMCLHLQCMYVCSLMVIRVRVIRIMALFQQ